MIDFDFVEELRRRDSDGGSVESDSHNKNYRFADEKIQRESDDEPEPAQINVKIITKPPTEKENRNDKGNYGKYINKKDQYYQNEEKPYVSAPGEADHKKGKYYEKYDDKFGNNTKYKTAKQYVPKDINYENENKNAANAQSTKYRDANYESSKYKYENKGPAKPFKTEKPRNKENKPKGPVRNTTYARDSRENDDSYYDKQGSSNQTKVLPRETEPQKAEIQGNDAKDLPKKIGLGYLKKLAKQNMYVEYIAKKPEKEKKRLALGSQSFVPNF